MKNIIEFITIVILIIIALFILIVLMPKLLHWLSI